MLQDKAGDEKRRDEKSAANVTRVRDDTINKKAINYEAIGGDRSSG